MTAYQFEGSSVLVKPPIRTESALVKDAIAVLAGNLVKDAGGADAGKYDISTLDATGVKGVATEARTGASTEKRPVTVVAIGTCRCVADGALTAGASIKSGAGGKVKALAAVDNRKLRIGRYEGTANAADGDVVICSIDVTENGVEA